MNRLKLIIKFINNGMLNGAYRVAYCYYGKNELYKSDVMKTLLLIDDFNNKKINFTDLKRSINVIINNDDDIMGYNKKLQKYNDDFNKAIVNFA